MKTGIVKDGNAEGSMAWLEFEGGERVLMDSFGARQVVEACESVGLLFLPGIKLAYETDGFGCLTWFDFAS